MKFFNKIALIFCLLFITNNFSQEKQTELYLDEAGKQITFAEHFNRKLSFLFSSKKIIKDSLTINVLSENYKLGKFDSIQNIQIRHYLSLKENNVLINDKTLIISFKDTVFGYEELKIRNLRMQKRHNNKCDHDHKLTELTLNKYKSDRTKSENFKIKKVPALLKSLFFKYDSKVLIFPLPKVVI